MDWTAIFVGSALGLALNALRSNRSGAQSGAQSGTQPEAPLTQKTLNTIPLPTNPLPTTPLAPLSQPSIIPTAYQAALDLAQFQSSFLARTSHELRSPMNALISSLQLISADLCDSPEEEREYVGIAHDAALKFIGLLDEVIKVSKLQTGTLEIQSTEIDLSLLLQEVYFITRLQAENRNLKLIIPMLEDELLIQADEAYLRQAIVILVDRAISLLDEGTIELVLAEDHDQFYLTIPAPEAIDALPPPPNPKSIPTHFTPEFRQLLAQEILSMINIPLTIQPETRLIQIILPRTPCTG